MTPNRLINEKSPYLLQHAYNPVQWYPWGDDAFEKAERENKPVFLSIGYSTCHWCHVMEKESFEDEDAAELLNRYFVPVKVDREERPDIDGIYMTVCQLLTGSGGWPLTILMTPDKKPFFAGTYFPKENRFGRTGLIDILNRINHIWQTRKDDVLKSAEEITGALKNVFVQNASAEVDSSLSGKVYSSLSGRFDALHGGFGNAPKFPTPHNLLFLLRYWKRTKEEQALEMVRKTLTEMRKGGIYDHIGGGFHRYSTDARWLVPHFEKMLYDQALIASVYLECSTASGDMFFREAAEEILNYVLRDMTSPDGGFYSAEDADSEGAEGKFYLWTEDEIKDILKQDAGIFINIFNVNKGGNWTDPVHSTEDGTNILHITEDFNTLARELKISPAELQKKISLLSGRLFKVREKRVHPQKDDKILTDWNALMISAFVSGYRASRNKVYLDAAEKAAAFILKKLTSGNNLLHRYRDGEASIPAHLDDYAFFIAALTDLYECTFNSDYLLKAVKLTDLIIKEFGDQEGGFFFTSRESEELITRQKDFYDGAVPSGNSAMLMNVLKLSRLTGNPEYERIAMKLASLIAAQIDRSPLGYTYSASALEFVHSGSFEIIITASGMNKDVSEILHRLNGLYIPGKVVMLVNPGDIKLLEAAPFLKDYAVKDNEVTIYVCRNYQCALPVHTIEEMLNLLR